MLIVKELLPYVASELPIFSITVEPRRHWGHPVVIEIHVYQ